MTTGIGVDVLHSDEETVVDAKSVRSSPPLLLQYFFIAAGEGIEARNTEGTQRDM